MEINYSHFCPVQHLLIHPLPVHCNSSSSLHKPHPAYITSDIIIIIAITVPHTYTFMSQGIFIKTPTTSLYFTKWRVVTKKTSIMKETHFHLTEL